MNNKIAFATLFAIALLSGIQNGFAADSKISGGMIQFSDGNLPKPEHQDTLPFAWTTVVEDMSNLKMDKLIIQRMKVLNNDAVRSPSECFFLNRDNQVLYNNDPLKNMLPVAQLKKMDVYVGLVSDESINGNNQKLIDAKDSEQDRAAFQKMLDDLAVEDLKVADIIWKQYSNSPAFAGWYLPLEPWNFKWQKWKNDAFNSYLKKVSTGLAAYKKDRGQGMKRLPVIWAPHFVIPSASAPYLANADETEALYKQLLDGAQIDILAVQDGYGAHSDRTNQQVKDYFKAFKNACEATPSDINPGHKMEIWSDSELYAAEGVPTTIDKLKNNICAVKDLVSAITCWDFFHYMSYDVPNTPSDWANKDIAPMVKSPQNNRQKLHDDYKRDFVDQVFSCP